MLSLLLLRSYLKLETVIRNPGTQTKCEAFLALDAELVTIDKQTAKSLEPMDL